MATGSCRAQGGAPHSRARHPAHNPFSSSTRWRGSKPAALVAQATVRPTAWEVTSRVAPQDSQMRKRATSPASWTCPQARKALRLSMRWRGPPTPGSPERDRPTLAAISRRPPPADPQAHRPRAAHGFERAFPSPGGATGSSAGPSACTIAPPVPARRRRMAVVMVVRVVRFGVSGMGHNPNLARCPSIFQVAALREA